MTLPAEVMELLRDSPPLPDRVDAHGRLDGTSAMRRLDFPEDGTFLALIQRGYLKPVRDDEGHYWFEPSELEKVKELEAAGRLPLRGPGRPTVGDVVETRLPRSWIDRIDKLARDAGATRAGMMRQLLKEAVAAREERADPSG